MNKKIFTTLSLIGLTTIISLLTSCSNTNSTPKNDAPINLTPTTENNQVKEIEIESFTKIVDGKYFPQYSIKEITVKKGGKVRLKINATSGTHDFKIDELNVYSETPTGKVTIIEFTPDKAGKFVYYCTKPNHKTLGHWGALIVTE